MLHLTIYTPALTLKNDAILKHMQSVFDTQKTTKAAL
jgi:hypothetical protein